MPKKPTSLGTFIRDARKAARISTTELEVAVLGVMTTKGSPKERSAQGSSVRMWELGYATPHLKRLPRLAEVLGISLPELWREYRHSVLEEQGFSIAEFEPDGDSIKKSSPLFSESIGEEEE